MTEQDPTATTPETPPPPGAPESLVLSAHTLGVLARDVAARLPLNRHGQAFAAALDDTARLADAWVAAQLDTRYTPVAPAAPSVALPGQLGATLPPQPATATPHLTKAAAVRAATAQLGPGATAPAVAQLVAQHHGLTVTDGSVRAVWSKDRKAAPPQPPQPDAQQPPQGTGMYL